LDHAPPSETPAGTPGPRLFGPVISVFSISKCLNSRNITFFGANHRSLALRLMTVPVYA